MSGVEIGIYMNNCTNLNGLIERNKILNSDSTLRHGIVADFVRSTLPDDSLPVRIENNTIRTAGDAIHLRISDHVDVALNDLEMKVGSFADSTEFSCAVRVEGGEHNRVYNNVAYSDSSNVQQGRTQMRGLYVDSSPETEMACNDVKKFGWSLVWHANSRPSSMQRNQITTAWDGMVFENSGEIDVQGAVKDPADNLFVDTFYNAHTHSINSFGQLSPIWTRTNLPGSPPGAFTTPTINLVSGGNSFQHQPASASSTYPNPLCQNFDVPPIDQSSVLRAIVKDTVPSPVWPDENKWKQEAWAFTELLRDSTLMTMDSAIMAFFQDKDSLALGYLCRAMEAVRSEDFGAASSHLAKVDPDKTIENALFNHLDILIAGALDGSGLDANEIATLHAIAEACPDDSGQATFAARALLGEVGEMVWFGAACSYVNSSKRPDAEVKAKNQSSEWTLDLWPNLANGNFTLQAVGTIPHAVNITISDKWGRAVGRITLDKFNLKGVIDASKWSAGLYFVSATGTDGSSFRSKVVIVK